MPAPLYIVIVNYNGKGDTVECLESLCAAGAAVDQILVVDNASTDGSIEALRDRFGDHLEIITCPRNLGYAGGVNKGVDRALNLSAEWLLLLNNDTRVDPEIFNELEQVMVLREFEIISPLILYDQDPRRIWSLGGRMIPGTLLTYKPGPRYLPAPNLPVAMRVDFISGCAMLIRRDVFARIGRFAEDYFMYAEEVDFCWRARKAGFHLGVATRARLWHKVSASSGAESTQTLRWRIVNQIRFYRRYAKRVQIPGLFMFTLLRSSWIGLRYLSRRQITQAKTVMASWRQGWA